MSNTLVLRLVGCALLACGLYVMVTDRAAIAEPPARDTKQESASISRFSRNFSAPTRLELASLQYLLTTDELADLLALRNEQSCERWLAEFWWHRDPNLATAENEARDEHDRRVEVATREFGHAEWPGWDQRGEVCIRYGLPLARQAETQDVGMKQIVKPTEFWYYPVLGMTVQFEDAFGDGNYTYFLENVDLPAYLRPSSDRTQMPAGLWKEQPDVNLDRMSLDVVVGTRTGHFGLSEPSNEFEYDDYQRSLFNFPEVLRQTPVVYAFDFDVMRVPFDFSVATFRDDRGTDRVDVNTEFEPIASAASTVEFRATAVIFDHRRNELARMTHATRAAQADAAAESVFTTIAQLPFTLPPDAYELAITLEEIGTPRFTSLRKTIVCDDFDRGLALSTVCFASRIDPVARGTSFVRGTMAVVPKPSARYTLATSVPVYFEVYNLTADTNGERRYRVSYRVNPQSPAPRGIMQKLMGRPESATPLASSFESAASGPHDVVYVFVKTDELWAGDYEFNVSVTDEVSKAEATRSGRFRLVK